MGSAIGASLPIAVGVMISPMPIVAVVLMLTSARARSNGFGFLLGWLVGILTIGAIVLFAVGAAAGNDDDGPAAWTGILKIVLGLGLLLLAVSQWRKRPAEGVEAPAPTWMAAIDSFAVPKSFGLGFLLGGINPKNLLLVASGAAAIAAATSDRTSQVVALVVFAVVASIGVAAPIVVYFALGDRAGAKLEALKSWMTHNNAVIMAVLLLVLGTKMIGDGISVL